MVGYFYRFFLPMFHLISYGNLVPLDYCLQPLNVKDCGGKPVAVASYYKERSRCEIELWRGCPTINMFPDEVVCSHFCIFKMDRAAEEPQQDRPMQNEMIEIFDNDTDQSLLDNEAPSAASPPAAPASAAPASAEPALAESASAEPASEPEPPPTESNFCDMKPGYRFFEDTEACYKLYTENMRWADAKTKCESDEAMLAVINSKVEADYLAKIQKETSLDCHLGVYKDGEWLTLEGGSVDDAAEEYEVWGEKQPLTSEEYRYGALSSTETGKIVTVTEDSQNPFICEKEAEFNSSQ